MITAVLFLLLFSSHGDSFRLSPAKSRSFVTTTSIASSTSVPSYTSAVIEQEVETEVVDWDWKGVVDEVFTKGDSRPVILFDGMCNLCNGGVNFALDHDPTGVFRFASLQSKVGKSLLLNAGKRPDDISSIVLVTSPQNSYFKSNAVLRIAQKLKGVMLPVIGFTGNIAPLFLKDMVYEFVADNRYRFGHTDSCRLEDDSFDDRFIPDP